MSSKEIIYIFQKERYGGIEDFEEASGLEVKYG